MNNFDIMKRWTEASSHREGKSSVIGEIASKIGTSKKNVESILRASGYWKASDMFAANYDLQSMQVDYQLMENVRARTGLPSGGIPKQKTSGNGPGKTQSNPTEDNSKVKEKVSDQSGSRRKVTGYRILKQTDEYKLRAEVEQLLALGWEPCGGVSIANTGVSLKLTTLTLVQAMVKYD